MPYLKRERYLTAIANAFKTHPIVALLGPRQCGKTTLAREFSKKFKQHNDNIHTFDLEDPFDLTILENPRSVLSSLEGLVILDEIQRLPEFFPILRVLVDDEFSKKKFLILGSASKELIRQSSETLAGRIAYLEVTPFSINEVDNTQKLWLQGGFPKSYLAESIDDTVFWREQYIKTFLENDIPNLGIRVPPVTLGRFWRMLAHYHGQVFNASEIGQSLGVADTTARHYLDLLVGTFMIRYLQPWFANSKKREVKTPKIYFRDSGIFHTLNGIADYTSLLHHPKLGASWEGFALEQITRLYQADPSECFFWGVHSQAELDLLIVKRGKKRGFEFKFNDAPKLTDSMKMVFDALQLDSLDIIYPGRKNYSLTNNIRVCGLQEYECS